MFLRGSRYAAVPDLGGTDGWGREVRYKAIRLAPPAAATEHAAPRPGDRPDHLAHRALLDPEAFWRLCDANDVPWPDDLVRDPRRRLRAPAPGE